MIVHELDRHSYFGNGAQESERTFRAMFDGANEAIFLLKDERFVDCNIKTGKMFGCPREAILQHYLYELSPVNQPDGHASAETFREYIQATLTGEAQQFEWKHIRFDGVEFDAEVSLNRIELGKKLYVQAIVRDISRRKRTEAELRSSEARFRAVFECSPLGIFMMDLNSLRLVESNPAFCRLLGYSHNKLLRKTLPEITHTQDCNANSVQLERMRSGTQTTLSGENRLTRKTGAHLWINWSATVIPDLIGQPAYGLVVVQDVIEPQNAVCAVQYRAEFEHLITTISTRFINVRMEKIDEELHCALREIGEFMEVDFGFLFLFSDDLATMNCVSQWARSGKNQSQDTVGNLSTAPYSLWLERLKAFKVCNDASTEVLPAREVLGGKASKPLQLKSLIDVPIARFGKLIGAIRFASIKEDSGSLSANLSILRNVAEIIGNTLERSTKEQTLTSSEERFRELAEMLPAIVFETNQQGVATFVNRYAFEATGYAPQDIAAMKAREIPIFSLLAPQDRERARQNMLKTMQGEILAPREYKALRKNGSHYTSLVRATPIIHDGTVLGVRVVMFDITEVKQAEETLRKLSLAVEQSPASVVITGPEGNIEYVNPKFTEVTGYTFEEVKGRNPRILKSGNTPKEVYKDIWKTIKSGKEWCGEFSNRRKNGELFWEYISISPLTDPDGSITHFVAVKEDITSRKQYEERLIHQANYDALTKLPNRFLALDRLEQAIAGASRDNASVALFFIDLDHFKRVNDTLGHAMGDELLQHSAQRLQFCVRTTDTVARLGGDEFLIILVDLHSPFDAEPVAEKILKVFQKPFSLDGHEFYSTASIGITMYPTDGVTPDVLLRNADAAMYRSKDEGRNAYHYFSPEMNQQALKRLALETKLCHALDRNEFSLVYQPQFDLSNGALVGGEALLRWKNPELGEVLPMEFIPVAEDTGLIVSISEFVLRAACKQARLWQHELGSTYRVAVNLSAHHFRDPRLARTVGSILEEEGLSPNLLEVEITESVLVHNVDVTAQILEELHEKGVRISVDDFGTGYSSLSYLKRFPVTSLKIDRAFVHDVNTDPENAALARAIIAMGHSLGLEVVGEGVETAEQLAFLRAEHCDMAQGYFFSQPVPSADFLQLLKTWDTNAFVRDQASTQ
jgi:diguanylate cyclase (GGDEF)-like protein/PAS domain S-box-containing protein